MLMPFSSHDSAARFFTKSAGSGSDRLRVGEPQASVCGFIGKKFLFFLLYLHDSID